MRHFVSAFFLAIFFSGAAFSAENGETPEIRVTLTADSANQGFEAWRAMDGDVNTMWHTQFSGPAVDATGLQPAIRINCGYGSGCNAEHQHFIKKAREEAAANAPAEDSEKNVPPPPVSENNAPHPHWLRVELERPCALAGFIYTPRRGAENGTIKNYECFVTNTPDERCAGAAGGVLVEGNSDAPVKVTFSSPVTGKFFTLTAISELTGGPFASCAELELIPADGKTKFVPGVSQFQSPGAARVAGLRKVKITAEMTPREKELAAEFNGLIAQLARPEYYKEIENQVADREALILPEDRNPVDVIWRRTTALAGEMRREYPDADISKPLKEIDFILNSAIITAIEHANYTDTSTQFKLFMALADIRRELMFKNPLLRDFSEILFVKKHRATFNHLCDQFYGINLPSGGGVFTLSDAFSTEKTPVVKNVLENSVVGAGRLAGQKLDAGAFVSPELSYDGKEIVFAYVECEGAQHHLWHTDVTRGHWERGRCLHIFKCTLDGTDLKMLTDGTWNDFDPVFLPNGRIAFISERRGGYLRCGRECPNYTLFDMDAEGKKLRCLSYHETNEWNPSVTNDGKIIYTRWDYIDRFGCIVHHPWITTLNGSDTRSVHGNFTPRHLRADAEFDCRAIPGSEKFVATGGPHHSQSFGSLILVDPRKDDEDQDAMNCVKRITPEVGFPESQDGSQVWGTPYALSEKLFLAVADFSQDPSSGHQGGAYGRGDYGIYLVDVFGNRELIYRDPEIGCISPIPVKARPLPVVRPELVDADSVPDQPYVTVGDMDISKRPQATVSVANVYQSLKPWKEGTQIKSLRVMQLYCMSVPSGAPPHETGPREPSSTDSVNLVRGVLGTVPVEADGSAHFTVPAQVEVFFQALDENGLAVQSMRSGTYFHPGDNVSCVGCHEKKNETPLQSSALPLAFAREPSALKRETVPGAWPVNFPQLVQPVLDAHCVECHARPESVEKGAFSLAREPYQSKWYASYNNLVHRGYAFYNYQDPLRTTPGEFGAHASRLYKILDDGHYDVELSAEEMHRITLWLDSLSLFYGCYEKENGEKQLRGEDVYPTLE